MGIKQTLDVINGMERDGVIDRYAIGGAVAAYNYIEPAVTEDLDIFVSFETKKALVSLAPILAYLEQRGYGEFEREGIKIEGWVVQFLPVADTLDAEALQKADLVEIKANGGKTRARVLRPEHLVAQALKVGRAKDYLRISQFIEEKAVNLRNLKAVLTRHKLESTWQTFCRKTGIRDPLAAK